MNAVKTIYYYFYLALILFAGCKPADFTLSTPTTAPGTFNHTAFLNTSCVQCHESKRPVTTPIHGNGQDCITCHSAQLNAQGVRTWLNLAHFDHNPMPTTCNQCHEGNRPNGVSGKPSIMPHLAGQWGATQDCASCHIYNQWKGKQQSGADFVHFDHNKTLTSCKECHNSSTRDDRPQVGGTLVETTAPYHPQAYFDFSKELFTGFNDGTIPTQAPNNATIGLTSDQSGLLNRINSKTLVAGDQLDCLTCHQNQTNDRVWSLTATSPNKSLFFKYDPGTLAVNQHLKVDPTTSATSEPTQCATCHEIDRPKTHINMDNSKSVIVPGMDTGDCKGCHVYTKNAGVPAPVITDWSNPVAFDHATAQPVTCIDCHKNSIPLSQRATLLSKATHPVATGTYYAIDCAKCHTYDNTLTPPFKSAPERSWANIAFDYRTHLKADGISSPSSCIQCHKIDNNSLPDPAINPSHTAGSRSSLDCKSCHVFNSTTKWYTFVQTFDHTKLDTVGSADRCDTCHKNSTMNLTTIKNPLANVPALATRPVNPVVHLPIPTGLDCNACHKVTTEWLNNPAKTNVVYAHGTTDKCSTCHNLANPTNIGMPAVVQKGSNHFPIGSMECSVCHTQANTSNYTTFTGTVFSHANTNGNTCSSCHNDPTFAGTVTKQLPLPQGTAHLVLPVGSDCNTCHTSTTTFTGMSGASIFVTYSHNLAIDVDCNSCHVNHTGFAKGTAAAPTTHMTIPMIVLNGSTTTNPVQCSTCHKEVSANGAALNIRTSPDFKIHTTANTQMTTSSSADTRCNVCHDGANATGKTPATYPTHPTFTGLQCVACHTASLSTTPKYKDFTGGGFVHTLAATNNNTTCNTCHAGASAIGKQMSDFAGHVPSTSECVACHTASLTSFTNFSNGNYPHNDGVACATCHGNTAYTSVTQKATSATGTVVHAATTAACNTCHADTATFTTWKIHTNATTTTDTSCNSCHTGLANTYGKQTTAYSGHVNIGTSQCISCHSNTLTKTPKYLDFTGGVYTHTGSETCSSCHGNASMNVTQPTLSVIHTSNAAAACTTCHTNTVGYTTWRIHTDAATSNKTSCTTCHMTTQTPLVIKNISSTGTYNHFGITKTVGGAAAECSTCHQSSMSVTTTTGPTGFIPTKFNGGLFHTNAVGSGIAPANNCTSCHTSSYSSLSATVMRMLPTTTGATPQHLTLPIKTTIPTDPAQCDVCHKDATFTAWKGMTLSTPTSTNVQYAHNVNATTDVNCSTCHTGATPGFAEGMSSYKNASGTVLHMSTTAQCSTCHQGADAGGTLTIKYTDFVVHSDVSTQTETRCNICHDGAGAIGKTTAAYVGTVGLPNHPTLTAGQQCIDCHQASLGTTPKYTTFAGGNQHTAGTTSNFSTCNTCHLSASGAIQNINSNPTYNHFPILKADGTRPECKTCHSASVNSVTPSLGFRNFTGGVFHANSASANIVGTCTSCHKPSTAYTPFKQFPAAHLPLPSGSECNTCHVTTTFTSGDFKGMPLTSATTRVTFTHSAANDGQCITCHTGAAGFAEGTSNTPGATHLTLPQSSGTNVSCDTCHNIKTVSGAVWKGMASTLTTAAPYPVAYNHLTMGTATCGSCHNDGTVAAAITHGVATGTATTSTSPYSAWTTPTARTSFNHIATGGANCINCHGNASTGGAVYPPAPAATTKTFAAYESFYGGTPKDHSSATTNCMGCHWTTTSALTGAIKNAPNTVGGFNHFNFNNAGGTTAQCYTCHSATTSGTNGSAAFVSWSGGKYHANATAANVTGTCTSCHKGTTAFTGTTQYPATHLTLPAGSDCSTCHNKDTTFTSWKGMLSTTPANVNVSYTHNTTTDTACNTCHQTNTSAATYTNKLGYATGYTNTTLHTSNTASQCSTCHTLSTLAPKYATNFKIHDATNTVNDSTCNTCHLNGTTFKNIASNASFSHFPISKGTTSAECQTCHQASITANVPRLKYDNFTGGLFHSNTLISGVPTTTCSTCHKATGAAYGGTTAISSLTSHLTLPVSGTTTDCSTCHVSTGWTGTVYNSATVRVNYAHNINVTTDAACSTCHDITKQVTGATPSNKGYATGKTAAITVHGTAAGAQQCSVCHMIVTGTGASSVASSKTTTDFKIHDTTNITASKNRCNVCHINTATSSATVASIKFYDASGTYTHFPVKTTATTATYAECSICHSNVIGTTTPFISTYSFASGKFHSNVTASSISATTCANCHNSASYTYEKVAGTFRKLATTHLPIAGATNVTANAECSVCHKVTNDSGTASNLWTGMALANAASPTSVALNVTYNHKAGDLACTTCHQGTTGYSEGNLSAGNGHLTIPLAPLSATAKTECSACHIVGTTGGATTLDSWKSWRATTPQVVYTSHNSAATVTCSSCHTNAAGFAKGTAADVNHPANTAAIGECNKCHTYSTPPNVTTGLTAYTSFSSPAPQDHRAAADCLSCHYTAATSTFKNINANPTYKHFSILNNTLAPVQCSTCHAASLTTFTNFTGGVFHATSATSAIATTTCTSCHNAGLTYGTTVFRGLPTVGTAHLNPSQPNLAVPGTTIGRGECSTCHTVDNSATPATANSWKGMLSVTPTAVKVTYTHNATNDTNCNACHSAGGLTKSGFATGYTSNSFHSTTVTAQCSTCHLSGTSTGAAPVAKFTPDFKVHTLADTSNGTSCNACHLSSTNTIQNNAVRSPGYKHFAYNNGATYAECNVCHTSSVSSTTAYPVINLTTGTFAGGLLHSKVPVSGVVTTACSTCHNNAANVTNGTTSFKVMPAAGTGHLNPAIGTLATPATNINRGECSICHTVSDLASPATANSWNGMLSAAANPVKVAYTHSATNDTNCNACHSLGATTKVGFATGYTSNSFHSTTVTAQCSTCHLSGTSTGAVPVAKFTPDFKVHTLADTTNGTKCNACHLSATNTIQNNVVHSNGYLHFPYGSAECAICHTGSVSSTTTYPVINLTTGSFAGGLLHTKATTAGVTLTAKCNTCHVSTNTTTATSFRAVPTSHLTLPTGSNCDTCHNITTATGLTWKGMHLTVATAAPYPVAYSNHPTSFTVTCTSCHANDSTAAKAGLADSMAQITPTNTHLPVPTGSDCNTCHNITTTSGVTWKGRRSDGANPVTVAFVHTGFTYTSCNTCHYDGTLSGATAGLPIPRGQSTGTAYALNSTYAGRVINTPHMATSGSECGGCHQASMTAPNNFTSFQGGVGTDHRLTATCTNCHWNTITASIANFNSSPGYKHFPITNTSGAIAQCSLCHQASMVLDASNNFPTPATGGFAGGKLHKNATSAAITTTACSTCHSSNTITQTYTYENVSGIFRKFPTGGHLNPTQPNLTATTTQITRGTGECNTCHTVNNDANATYTENTWSTYRAPLNPLKAVTFTTGGVFTSLTTHGLLANDPITFKVKANGSLPTQITAGTTYYVKSVVSTTQFTISTTPGGTAITTLSAASNGDTYIVPVLTFNAPTFAAVTSISPAVSTSASFSATGTITVTSSTGLAVGDPVQLSGTIPTNLSTNAIYYINSITPTTAPAATITLRTTAGGTTAVTPALAAVTGTTLTKSNVVTTTAAHGIAGTALPLEVTFRGTLATGLVADQIYYVSSILSATSFTISSTVSSSVSFTGTTASTSVNIGTNLAVTGTSSGVTFSKPVAATITYPAHGLAAGALVTFGTTGRLPDGIAAGQAYQVNTVSGSTFTLKQSPVALVTTAGTTYAPAINILSGVAPTGIASVSSTNNNVYTGHDMTNDSNCNACHTGATGYSTGKGIYLAPNNTTALHITTTAQCSTCHAVNLDATFTLKTGAQTFTGFAGGNYLHTTGSNTFSVASKYHPNQPACTICHNNYTSQPASLTTVMWLNKEAGVTRACAGCHVSSFNTGKHMNTHMDSGTRNSAGTTTSNTYAYSTSTSTWILGTNSGENGRSACLSCHGYGTSVTTQGGTAVTTSDGNRVQGYTPKTAQ